MEIWKPIAGYEGLYDAGSSGRVRSLDRVVKVRCANGLVYKPLRGMVLKSVPGRKGYQQITLSKGGKYKLGRVSRLVCAAFHGPCPNGFQCAHLDGSKDNDVPSNLKWVTPRENQAHRKLHGTYLFGETAPNAALTEVAVISIKKDCRNGVKKCDLAIQHGVSQSLIGKIMKRKTWRHVP